MNIDEIDIRIILCFLESPKKSLTVVDVVKTLFTPKNRTDLTNKVSMINYRLSKWVEQGIFTYKINDEAKHYSLLKKKVIYGNGTLIIGDYSIEAGTALALQTKDNNYLSVCFFKKENV